MDKSLIDLPDVGVEKVIHNTMKKAAEEVMEKTGLRVDDVSFDWDSRALRIGEKFPKSPTNISIMTTS